MNPETAVKTSRWVRIVSFATLIGVAVTDKMLGMWASPPAEVWYYLLAGLALGVDAKGLAEVILGVANVNKEKQNGK